MESLNSVMASLIGIVILMIILMWLGYKLTSQTRYPLCPYTKTPLRPLNTLHYMTLNKVKRYMVEMEDLDNRVFDLNRASYSRETGRIFPNTINWRGKIHVDWSFIQKRMKGVWISWGSLSDDRKQELFDVHGTLQDFQTEYSSANPHPKDCEPEFNTIKPGPLYVNLETNVVMGWKVIPDTELEVLVVKRPMIYI